jgi:hypothetical protein
VLLQQPDEPVGDAGGEHDDGDFGRTLIGSYALRNLPPIMVGQHHVEDKAIGGAVLPVCLSLFHLINLFVIFKGTSFTVHTVACFYDTAKIWGFDADQVEIWCNSLAELLASQCEISRTSKRVANPRRGAG